MTDQTLVIYFTNELEWKSCQHIAHNLCKLYKLAFKNRHITFFPYKKENLDKIYALKFSKIVFIGPSYFITSTIKYFQQIKLDHFLFSNLYLHIYGDFTFKSQDWLDINPILKNKSVTIFSGSKHQKKLLAFFIENNKNNLHYLPFPVDQNKFKYKENIRKKIRNQLGLNSKDIVIIYTGRISTQKNILLLIKEFSKISIPDFNFHLWIVGGVDDIGVPLHGALNVNGTMFYNLNQILNTLSDEQRKKITIWGNKDSAKVCELLNAADIYSSLGLHHDEDFGMAPAEALMTGLPAILTAWGGHHSFQSPDDLWDCQLIDVEIRPLGLQINTSQFHQHLKTILERKKKLEINRTKRALNFEKVFGINNYSSQLLLKNIDLTKNECFKGMKPNLENFVTLKQSKESHQLIASNTNFYYKIYSNYLSKDSKQSNKLTPILWHLENSDSKYLQYAAYDNYFDCPYFNLFTPIVLSKQLDFSLVINKKNILLRDGAIPISYLLAQLSPTKNSPFFYIHLRHKDLIPFAWRDHVRLFKNFNSKERKTKKILIASPIDASLLIKGENASFLKKTLLKHLTKKIFFYIENSNEKFILQKFAKKINVEIFFITYNEIININSLNDFLYIEINNHNYLTETNVKQLLLSKGINIEDEFLEIEDLTFDQQLMLGFNHGLKIYSFNHLKQCPPTRKYLSPYHVRKFRETELKRNIDTFIESIIKEKN